MSDYIIHEETLTGIADAIREMRYEDDQMTPAQMEAKIRATKIGTPIDIRSESHINPVTGRWERPEGWPDLDSLTIDEDFDGVYLTYDLSLIDTPFLSIYCYLSNTTGKYRLERGHIDNGSFVVDATDIANHNTYIRQALDPANGRFQVFRVIADNESHKIRRFAFGPSESSSTSTCLTNSYQPCIERVGRIDYANSFESSAGNTTSVSWTTYWLEHDYVRCAGKYSVTSIGGLYNMAISLQEVNVDWNTNTWNVKSLVSLFSNCNMLENLIGIENWDTSNWQVSGSGLSSMFYSCAKLRHLPIGGWDTSKWSPTSFSSCFTYCRNLRELDLSGWDVSGFRITTMYIMFMNCGSLVKLDLSTWDVSEWPLTNMQYLFSSCQSLQELDLSGWDVSGWRPTTLYNSFATCRSLKELDLSSWDVSEWPVTSISGLFNMCNSLRRIKTGWDTSKWAVTDCASLFSYCLSLKEHDADKWDVSNWHPTSMSNMFGNCVSLKELDLSGWDCSKWAITRVDTFIGSDLSLVTLVLPENLDLSKVTDVSDFFRNTKRLTNVNRIGVPKAMNYSELHILSPQSLVNILNSLPTVSSATTITLGLPNKHKLTAEQIAIATQKGWTVA